MQRLAEAGFFQIHSTGTGTRSQVLLTWTRMLAQGRCLRLRLVARQKNEGTTVLRGSMQKVYGRISGGEA